MRGYFAEMRRAGFDTAPATSPPRAAQANSRSNSARVRVRICASSMGNG